MPRGTVLELGIGDLVVLGDPRGWVALFNDRNLFAEHARLRSRSNPDLPEYSDLQATIEANKARKVESGTLARVTDIHAPGSDHDPIEASLDVLILEGPHLNLAGNVARTDASRADQQRRTKYFLGEQARLRATPAAKPGPQPDRSKELRASRLLQLADSLAKGGKEQGAQNMYRQIAKDFPYTPAGVLATERIKRTEPK
jgi:hypothetical protein